VQNVTSRICLAVIIKFYFEMKSISQCLFLYVFILNIAAGEDAENRRLSIGYEVFPSTTKSIINYSAGEHSTLFIEYTSESSGNYGDTNTEGYSVWGMGWNSQGIYGNGTTVDENIPTQLFDAAVRKVSAGYFHSLFLHDDGSLWGSGSNGSGQLGDGTTINKISPIKVVPRGVVDVDAGVGHSAFIKEDGSLWTMGDNQYGQLGLGNYSDQSTPVKVIDQDVLFVDVGGFNTLFIKSDGSLWGMGENEDGQLGIVGPKLINTPTEIISGGVIMASFGWNYLAFVKNDNSLWALGSNEWGQLGNGTDEPSSLPVMIEPSGVMSVSAGGGHLLYIKEDGSLWGVGRNSGGRLGIGNDDHQYNPVRILEAKNEFKITPFGSVFEYTSVVSVSAGGSQTLFMKSDGSLWGMGSNWIGGLGQGQTVDDELLPVEIIPSSSTDAHYIVTILTSDGGTAEGGGSIPYNRDAKLTALPSPGYKFYNWSQDLNSLHNPFTFRRYHDLTVKANFIEDTSDDDGDGLTNYDEWVVYETNASNPDTDGDGVLDKKEIDDGTDPNQSDVGNQDGDSLGFTPSFAPFVNGWFYEPSLGWLYTNRQTFPYIFDSDQGAWMYFTTGEPVPKFWHFGKSEWIELK